MLGEKLRGARIKAGLSLKELETKINKAVSAQAIGKYERDEMLPSPHILESLAKTLNVQPNYLTSVQDASIGTIEFRENKLRNKADEKVVEGTISYHLMRYLKAEELAGVSRQGWDKPRQYPLPVRDLKDAEWAAHRLRDDWGLGSDPLSNISEFLEERGFKIMLAEMPESIAGVTCFVEHKEDFRIPVIVTNKKITGERQRFTIAHELGHLLLDFEDSDVDIEQACNKFAGALLMPERLLWDVLGKNRKNISIGELVDLKKVLGVSVQALTFRSKDLEIINTYTYRSLYKEFSSRGWLKPPYAEPELLDLEEPKRFRRLCLRLLAENVIDIERTAEFLDISTEEVKKQFNGTFNS